MNNESALSPSRLERLFRQPPAEYRSAPFWSWNDKLEPEELGRQIKALHEGGSGGFFMHSREGLETPYMGHEWMEAVCESVKTAERLGMYAWLYDEDRWPSGSAGGRIPAQGDAFRAKGLTIQVGGDSIWTRGEPLAALFRASVDGMALRGCVREDEMTAAPLADGEAWLAFRVEVSRPSEWFNGESPPDNLNPDTVQAFIEDTYEAYRREIGEQFGRVVRGIFSDEPSVHDRNSRYSDGRGWIPWSDGFADFFRERRGYDFLDAAPGLFFHAEDSPAVRHDYWRTMGERFAECYSKQLGEWCEQHGLAFTGHYLQEDKLGTATRVAGAIMPHYRFQHIPGIDILDERTDEYMTVKQCTSVARQYGRPHVITETYGCTGWAFTFEGQRWIGDWQYVLGVTMRCQHLGLYSIRGCRKRDYPPVFGYNTNWWPHNRAVEDYFARLGAVLSAGEAVRDVLILHPASTAWSMLGSNPYELLRRRDDRDLPEVDAYGDRFNAFLRALLGLHYDFDLGDETIMEESGEVKEGKLYVGQAGYKAVLLPPIRTMLRSTYHLLLAFLDAGGRVVAAGPQADMLEGRPAAEELKKLYGHRNLMMTSDEREASMALERVLPRQVSLRAGDGEEASRLLYLLKDTDEGSVLFIVNNDHERGCEASVQVARSGHVELWDSLTGEISEVSASVVEAGGTSFRASLGPADSKLFLIRREKRELGAEAPGHREQGTEAPVRTERIAEAADRIERTGEAGEHVEANDEKADRTTRNGEAQVHRDRLAGSAAPAAAPRTVTELGPAFAFSRTMPNALVLDRCAYRLAGGDWSEEMDVWQAQRCVREALGMRPIHENGLEQRYTWIDEPHPSDGAPVDFRFVFEVDCVPERIEAVIEQARHYRLALNGRALDAEPEGWFLDRAFDRIRLPEPIAGTNELILSCAYTNAMEMEDVYLVGDFGVDSQRRIGIEPARLHTGDWTKQGYLHYCGSMVYRHRFDCEPKDGSCVRLYLGRHSAVTASIRVNGFEAGQIPWRSADGLDVTKWLHAGSNLLEIELVGSPRNLLGPFHDARENVIRTEWHNFRTEGEAYTPSYNVHPYGLFDGVRLIGG
ncbi:glycosyl hydrolase [Paenibacillus sp. HB172176]|uniref:glycosyl hydrolase n=1 Tax=Paenibacillus sp. HB172176 TaxID=2493690 RepID=UPI00143BAC93|nr:glycosyl hydrolase [Paenibacillus sp. HB172176]